MPPGTGRLASRRRRRIVTHIVSLAAATATALAFAGPAPAEDADDEAGYLDYVRGHGVPYSNLNPDGVLGSGYHYCALIREGMSSQRIIDSDRGISLIWTPTIVYAAQHFLCRETLTEAELAAEAAPEPGLAPTP